LLNHAAFHDAVSSALGAGGADAEEVALVLFDLDYLKLINDVHGHQMGDQALRCVAEVLRTATRESDRVARLGGDEFAALFVGVERELVLRIAERAVSGVCATHLPGVGRLSVSAGVAFVASTREPGDLFDRADAAVYDAKARGRGVVSVADMTEIAYASRRRDLAGALTDLPPPELADARDVVTAARGALREWVHVLACSGGCVDLLDAEGQSVKAVAYYRFGHDDWKLAEQTYALDEYPNTARALAQGQVYTCRVDDPDSDPAEAALLRERGFSSLLLTPLVSGGRAIGIMELFDTRPRVFTTADQRIALSLSHHLAPLLAVLQDQSNSLAARRGRG
jgi:diguanylate cyclase (GGDEF)-like protein